MSPRKLLGRELCSVSRSCSPVTTSQQTSMDVEGITPGPLTAPSFFPASAPSNDETGEEDIRRRGLQGANSQWGP